MAFTWQCKKPEISTQGNWIRPSIEFFDLSKTLLFMRVWKVENINFARLFKGSKEVVDVKVFCKLKALERCYH